MHAYMIESWHVILYCYEWGGAGWCGRGGVGRGGGRIGICKKK